MLHHAPLLTTIAVGFVAAFVLGLIAQKLRLSPIVGYLVAGLISAPFTPSSSIEIIARGHRDADVEYLAARGADRVVVGVHEVADIMIEEVEAERSSH